MVDWNQIFSGLINVCDGLINPSFISFSDVEKQLGGIIFIGLLFVFIGITAKSLREFGKPVAVIIGVIFALSLMKDDVKLVISITAIFGCLLRFFGGIVLVRYFFGVPAAGLVFGVLLTLSIAAGFILLPTFTLDTLAILKLLMSIFSGIGTYNFLYATQKDSLRNPSVLWGMTVLVGISSLVDFGGSLSSSAHFFGIPIAHLFMRYSFFVGLIGGLIAGIIWLLKERYYY